MIKKKKLSRCSFHYFHLALSRGKVLEMCSVLMIFFLLLCDFSLQKELETRAGAQQLMEKLIIP